MISWTHPRPRLCCLPSTVPMKSVTVSPGIVDETKVRGAAAGRRKVGRQGQGRELERDGRDGAEERGPHSRGEHGRHRRTAPDHQLHRHDRQAAVHVHVRAAAGAQQGLDLHRAVHATGSSVHSYNSFTFLTFSSTIWMFRNLRTVGSILNPDH